MQNAIHIQVPDFRYDDPLNVKYKPNKTYILNSIIL